MTGRLALFLFLTQVSALLSAQDVGEEKKAVGFIFGTVHPRNKDGGQMKVEIPLGTAFFVHYPDSRLGPDLGFLYLVTAKHVLKDADGSFLKEVKLRVNLKEDKGAKFITNIPVADAQGNLLWLHDKDEAIDVAATLFATDDNVDFKSIPATMFADDTTFHSKNVAEGDVLYFIGLMAQYYGERKNYPVVRHGTLALMTEEKIETPTGRQNAFIAELASWPGNSGSPVFLNLSGMRNGNLEPGWRLSFLGILCGSFLNKFSATTIEAATLTMGDDSYTGISYVVPATSVKAVLDSTNAQAMRDAVVQQTIKSPKLR